MISNEAASAVSGINQKYLSANKMNTKDNETAMLEMKMDFLKFNFPKIRFVTGVMKMRSAIDLIIKKSRTQARSFVNSFMYKIGLPESLKIYSGRNTPIKACANVLTVCDK